MKRRLAQLVLGAALAAPLVLQASSARLPDYSDLWWNAAESGWGAHVTLQDDVAFLVIYVHDAAAAPRFFVASGMSLGSAASDSVHEFRGELYRTRGSSFAGAYDAGRFAATPVGHATLRFTSSTSGSLTYDVDGTTVTKAITRQTWAPLELAGSYRGGAFGTTDAACTAGAGLPTFGYPGSMQISQSGDAIVIEAVFEPGFAEQGRCRYAGRLAQFGSIASVTQGTYACEFVNGPSPVAGSFEVHDLEVGEHGFSGRLRAQEPGCVLTGRIGGIRRGYGNGAPAAGQP
jgi:hypothetical protein